MKPTPTPATPANPAARPAELQRRAEAQVRKLRRQEGAAAAALAATADPQRLLHELQVHQVELELQNEELRKVRDQLEAGLEKYSDLYDFAPVGYFTIDADGSIQQVNLTGASLTGLERSRLVGQPFGALVVAESLPVFNVFLERVLAGQTRHSCEVTFRSSGRTPRTVSLEAQRSSTGRECRVVVTDITEHRQAEDKVRVSEIRYRRLFEAAHDGVLLLDPGTRKITDANPFMTKLLGYPYEQLVGKELFEIGLLKDEAASQEMFRKLKRKHGVRYENLPLEDRDGRHQEVEVVANLYQEDGRAVIQCNIRDITERKRAMDALHRSEERYRSLFTSMDEGYCIIEMLFDKRHKPVDWRFLEVNPSFEKHNGLHGATGKLISELAPGLEASWFATYGQVAVTGEPVRFEHQAKALGGRWFNLYAFRVGGADSRKVAILFTDITARKHTEQELAEKARLLDLSHDAIIVRSAQGRIRYWNHGAEELYGWSAKEALDQLSHRLLKTEYPKPLKHITAELHRTDRWIGELVHTARDGRRITVLVRKTLDRDAAGRPASVLQTITDITARKQAEAAQLRLAVLTAAHDKLAAEIVRRQAVEETLRHSERQQGRLLEEARQLQEQLRQLSRQVLRAQEEERKRISRELHDVIAQTLAGINVRLAALQKAAAHNPAGLADKLARAQRLVEKSVDLVHQFARELRPTMLDDLGLIPALHAFLKSFTTRTGVRTSLTAFAEIEQLDTAPRTVLYRVAQEALTNVGKHAHASHVAVSLRKLPAAVRMEIKDDGQSFAVDRVLKSQKNQRLGLIGMRERVEMVGGKFAVASTPGAGTTIQVELPFPNGGGGKGV